MAFLEVVLIAERSLYNKSAKYNNGWNIKESYEAVSIFKKRTQHVSSYKTTM